MLFLGGWGEHRDRKKSNINVFEPLALRLLKQAPLSLTQLGSHIPNRNGLTQREDVGSSPRMGSHWSQILIPSNLGLLSSALKSLAGSSAQKKASSLWLAGLLAATFPERCTRQPVTHGSKRAHQPAEERNVLLQPRFSLWRLFLSPFLSIYMCVCVYIK